MSYDGRFDLTEEDFREEAEDDDESSGDSVESDGAEGDEADEQDDGWNELLDTVNQTDAAKALQKLLAAGADANYRNRWGFTPLMAAAFRGHVRCLRVLLDAGAHPNAADDFGATALHCAAQEGQVEAIRLLVQAGARVDVADTRGKSPLYRAAEAGKTRAALLLTEHGGTADLADKAGTKALLKAAESGDADLIRLLLQCGAAVDARDPQGETALCWAAREGHTAAMSTLLEGGATVDAPDKNDITPLMAAALHGRTSAITLLLAAGADPHYTAEPEITALGWAEENGHTKAAALIRKAMAGSVPRARPVVGPRQHLFIEPVALCCDDEGNVFAADVRDHSIWRFTSRGEAAPFVGRGEPGFADGPALDASLNGPGGVTLDGQGNLVVSDLGNHCLRRTKPDGTVETLRLEHKEKLIPVGLAVREDLLYFSTGRPQGIWTLGTDGTLTRIAGSGAAGHRDGPAQRAQFHDAFAIAVAEDGTVFASDSKNHCIRRLRDGMVETIAGAPGSGGADASARDGAGGEARLCEPHGLALHPDGSLFVADSGNHSIRRLVLEASQATVTTVAGGAKGYRDGPLTEALFDTPRGLCIDPLGNVFVGDTGNGCLRRISPDGQVSTVAVSIFVAFPGRWVEPNEGEAALTDAHGIACGPDGSLWVTEAGENVLWRIEPGGRAVKMAGGREGRALGPGAAAELNFPLGVAAAADGEVFVCDSCNRRVCRLVPPGILLLVAGSGEDGLVDDEDGSRAEFSDPRGIAIGPDGLYLTDDENHVVRTIRPDGAVLTVAGNGEEGYVDEVADSARFRSPEGLAVDMAGNIVVSDYGNNRIRRIAPGGATTTIAGTGEEGSADGPAREATFHNPCGLALAPDGRILVAERGSGRVRVIAGGQVSSLRDAKGNPLEFAKPDAVACDAVGNVFVTAGGVFRVSPQGEVRVFVLG